jgi:NAD(P)-dependent dehydrogenase (short-subunit alcohol dehydrogenase family)
MELDKKVAIITGGASGIGAACARAFSARGARVVIADVEQRGARRIAEEIGAIAVACDVASGADVRALVQTAERSLGHVDLFFSNAGIATGRGPLDTELDVWQRQWEVNLLAHVHAVRAVLPAMLERGAGYLIHTASMAGVLIAHGNLPYTVTKHAVVGLAEWLSITYHDRGIRVSLLAPLGVRTPMLGDPQAPFASSVAGPIKEPEEVAEMVAEAVREERFLILTDPVARTWMERKTQDLERWLRGMRRVQGELGRGARGG